MLRLDEIQEKLLHIIGWQQDNTSGITLSDRLTKSETGLYFQQAHPLLTLTNLSCIAPDYQNMSALDISNASYRKDGSYSKGSIVSTKGNFYMALHNNALAVDIDNKDSWAIVDAFSLWLENKVKSSIVKVVNRFCTEKINDGTLKTLCEDKALFENTGRIVDTVANRNRLVGFEIVPIRSNGVTIKINRIGLQFTKPGIYTLYLMHSSSFEPIQIITVQKNIKGFEWIDTPNLFLPYKGQETDAGGSWYLCYKQSELPNDSLAIKKDKDWSKGPCNSCSRKEFMAWQAWSKYLEIHPFYISEESAEDIDGSTILWDIANNVYTYDNNYGINLDITVCCDITDFIIEKRAMFQSVLMKQVAVDMLRELAYNANVRTNRHTINASRTDILYEIDGDSSSMKKSGLNYQLDEAFRAINIEVRGLDRVCMPCKNNGIKYRTI